MKALRRLHLLHKSGNFIYWLGYHRRRNEARNDKSFLSIVVDTMDNSHCYVPYFAGNDQLSKSLHQGILGCLDHGNHRFTVYRTTGNTFVFIYPSTPHTCLKNKNNFINDFLLRI